MYFCGTFITQNIPRLCLI